MKHHGITDKMQRMVELLYETFECAVLGEVNQSDWFRITAEVKQGCVMLGWNLTTQFEDLDFAEGLALISSK